MLIWKRFHFFLFLHSDKKQGQDFGRVEQNFDLILMPDLLGQNSSKILLTRNYTKICWSIYFLKRFSRNFWLVKFNFLSIHDRVNSWPVFNQFFRWLLQPKLQNPTPHCLAQFILPLKRVRKTFLMLFIWQLFLNVIWTGF